MAKIKTAYYNSSDKKLGLLKISYDGETLVELEVAQREEGKSVISKFSDRVFREVEEYLAGSRSDFSVRVKGAGTPFQEAVWRELMKIPYGATRTYGEIAQAIGNPKAGRAVGGACNKNPICLIVPCHRVIGSDGSLTGYAGGIAIKERLLKLERENKEKLCRD